MRAFMLLCFYVFMYLCFRCLVVIKDVEIGHRLSVGSKFGTRDRVGGTSGRLAHAHVITFRRSKPQFHRCNNVRKPIPSGSGLYHICWRLPSSTHHVSSYRVPSDILLPGTRSTSPQISPSQISLSVRDTSFLPGR